MSSGIDDTAEWDRIIQQSPMVALDRARGALADATTDQGTATLLYAIGRSQLELGQIAEASHAMRRAVDLVVGGVEADDEIRRAVLMTSAVVFAEAGDVDRALDNLAVLERECEGTMLGRVRMQQAVVLQHAGRINEALAALDESDRLFAGESADRDRFRVHMNRGVVLLQRGDYDAAEADFRTAGQLAQELGMTAAEGQCHANTGALFGRSRRLVEALQAFDRAAELLVAAGRPERVTTWMEIDRAEVMMHSGLVDDAVEAAHRALSTALPSENAMLIGDALMMCARAELGAGRLRPARRTASEAASLLARTGRTEMVAHAEEVLMLAALQEADADDAAEAFDRSSELVERLRELGWHQQADELSIERIRAAWRIGVWSDVDDDLSSLRLHAFGVRRDLALLGWFAEAVSRRLRGDDAGAIEASRAGLGFLDDIIAEANSLEERSAATRLGRDLSRLIIEVATAQGDPDLALAASEGTRARALHDELDQQARHRPLDDEGAERLRTELRGRLHRRCLVQWVVAAGRVVAVVCDRHGNRLVDVADHRSLIRERDRLLVWLDRAAAEPDDSSDRAMRAARLLDDLLIGPLDLPEGASVVMVPVDELHGVPWSGLPSLADREIVLSPSCRLWLDADRRSSAPVRSIGLVSGPDVVGEDIERAALMRLHPRIDHAGGAGATAVTVRAMFGGHELVHVAAHGRFRSDRPLLSTLQLADGDVPLHQSVPDRVHTKLAVLSSCEGGAHGGSEGSEVLGLAAVLLARGAASVLAPLTVVRDLECGEFVSEVHAELARAIPFGEAVASVRARWLADDDLSRWAVASSFNCFGSGATRLPGSAG